MNTISPNWTLIFLRAGCLLLLATLAEPALAELPPGCVIPVDRNNIWQEVFKSEQQYVLMAFTHANAEKVNTAKGAKAEKEAQANCDHKAQQADEHCKQLQETLNKLAHQHTGKVKFVKLDIGNSPLITREFRKLLRVDSETFVCIVMRSGSQIAGKALPGEPGEEAVLQLIDEVTNNKTKLTKPSLMQSIRLKLFLEYLWNQNGILDQTAATILDVARPSKK